MCEENLIKFFYQCTLYFNFELCQVELSPDVIPHGLSDEVDSILSKSCFKSALKIYVGLSERQKNDELLRNLRKICYFQHFVKSQTQRRLEVSLFTIHCVDEMVGDWQRQRHNSPGFWVRSQYPPTQWHLRGDRWKSVDKVHEKPIYLWKLSLTKRDLLLSWKRVLRQIAGFMFKYPSWTFKWAILQKRGKNVKHTFLLEREGGWVNAALPKPLYVIIHSFVSIP